MTTLTSLWTVPRVQENDPPYQQIAAHYRQLIQAGELKPGQVMPTIPEIRTDWGVSLSTAGRAMALLRDGKWVVTAHGKRTTVASHPPT